MLLGNSTTKTTGLHYSNVSGNIYESEFPCSVNAFANPNILSVMNPETFALA